MPPTNAAKEIMEAVLEVDIYLPPLDPGETLGLGLGTGNVVRIVGDGSAVEKAGFKSKDTIISIVSRHFTPHAHWSGVVHPPLLPARTGWDGHVHVG